MGIVIESAIVIFLAVIVTLAVERTRRGGEHSFWDAWLRALENRPDYEGRHRA